MNSPDVSDAQDLDSVWLTDSGFLKQDQSSDMASSSFVNTCALAELESTDLGFPSATTAGPIYSANEFPDILDDVMFTDQKEDAGSSIWTDPDSIYVHAPDKIHALHDETNSNASVSPTTQAVYARSGSEDWSSKISLSSPPHSRKSSSSDPEASFTFHTQSFSSLSHDAIEGTRFEEEDLMQVPSEASSQPRRRPHSLNLSLVMSGPLHSLPSSAASTEPNSALLYRSQPFECNSRQVTPPPSADIRRHKHSSSNGHRFSGRSLSVAKMPLSEMYREMGMQNNHSEGAEREIRIMQVVKANGFDVGAQTWIRDTNEDTRNKILDDLETEFRSWGYDRALLEKIVRRGTYARMQSNLRRDRRQRAARRKEEEQEAMRKRTQERRLK